MIRKREKNYWEKRSEPFAESAAARSRAGILRSNEHVTHVTVRKQGTEHVVSYSVAKWYLDELKNAGLKL